MDVDAAIWGEDEGTAELQRELQGMSAEQIQQRTRLLENEIRVLKDESTRLGEVQSGIRERIKDNQEKIKLNKQLPYLVANVVEILEPDAEDGE